MRRLNAKKIAAVVSGAALLGFGLAFAGSITYSSVPIINNAGQPVVQVVIGHGAQPSDGVAAGNIAAAIGNLAWTQTTKVFPANVTEAQSVLGVSASPSQFTLSNQKVTLNVSSSTVLSGSYSFTALIGSVLNHAIQLGSPTNTKTLQSTGTYAYQETTNYLNTPSPYTSAGGLFGSVQSSYNGGGIQFNSFQAGSTYDNVVKIDNSNLPTLLSNAGSFGETETLWVAGFPVYNQNLMKLALVDAQGAYAVNFNNPIHTKTGSNTVNNAAFELLGQNWTVITYTPVSGSASANKQLAGGKLSLASSLTPLTTLNVGQNLTVGDYRIQLTGLGNTNSSGVSQAAINIYFQNGASAANQSIMTPGVLQQFNVSGNKIFVSVNQTFNGGSFAYQQWAKVQLYTNVYNLTNGQAFNKTNDPGWNVNLLWTNASNSGTTYDALKGIVIYNTSSTMLTQGQSLSFIQNPSAWKLQFVGTTLGQSGYDQVTAALDTQGSVTYKNNAGLSSIPGLSISNITEPTQELLVSSSIPNAFTLSTGQVSQNVRFALTPYELVEIATTSNTASKTAGANTLWVRVLNANAVKLITSTDPLTVTLTGAATSSSGVTSLASATFQDPTSQATLSSDTGVSSVYNVTAITVSKALPVTIQVGYGDTALNAFTAANQLATLALTAPAALYTQQGKDYLQTTTPAASTSVTYNQQNGQPTSTFSLNWADVNPSGSVQFGNFIMGENPVPSSTSFGDNVIFSIYNSSAGSPAYPEFQLNQSNSGTKNNMTYVSSQGYAINAPVGFVTERGSNIGSINPTSVAVNLAENVNQMQFAIGPSSNTTLVHKGVAQYTYGLGQAVALPGYNGNVTVGAITATVSPTGAGGQNLITGIENVTSSPVVVSTPVLLNSLPTTPLVVLDSQANTGDLILIGSDYVNTLSAAMQTSLNIPDTQLDVAGGKIIASGNQILVAGWTADQTTAAANSFIQALYQQAASG